MTISLAYECAETRYWQRIDPHEWDAMTGSEQAYYVAHRRVNQHLEQAVSEDMERARNRKRC